MEMPALDEEAAHAHFAKTCVDVALGVIEQTDRTPDHDERMIRSNQASLRRRTQRTDCSDIEERDLVLPHLASLEAA